MHGHRTPPASDVQEPHPGPLVEAELSRDEVMLGVLGRFETHGVGDESSTRVRQAGSEHQFVEPVPDVVVMTDHFRVPPFGVSNPPWRSLFLGSRRRGSDHTETSGRLKGTNEEGDPLRQIPGSCVAQTSEDVHEVATEVEITRDEGPGQAELARSPHQTTQRIRRVHDDGPRPRRVPEGTAVPELKSHTGLVSADDGDDGPQHLGNGRTRGRATGGRRAGGRTRAVRPRAPRCLDVGSLLCGHRVLPYESSDADPLR